MRILKAVPIKDLNKVVSLQDSLFITFGFFDGFHVGHRRVLHQLLARCKYYRRTNPKVRSLVVTFETLPEVDSSRKKHIYPKETKLDLLADMGIDYCLLLDFYKVRELSYKHFLDFFLAGKMVGLVASDKLCLGFRRQGTPEHVKKYLLKKGSCAYFLTSLKSKNSIEKKVISSTEIRHLLSKGKLYQANRKLLLPFHIIGKVGKGKRWGRKIGFPTINFPYPIKSVQIPPASYVTITVIKGKVYSSMSYVGTPMGKKNPVVETYLLNFSKSVYNSKVTVYFIKNLEKNKKLRNLTDLQKLLNRLANRLQSYLEGKPVFFQKKLQWIKKTIK